MSNAEKILKKQKIEYIIHTYSHDEDNIHFAQEASEKLGVEVGRIYKTLIVEGNGELFVVIISATDQLDFKKLSQILQVKKIKMGNKSVVEKTTGYVFGGISPIGQKKKLRTFLDSSAQQQKTIYISAGNKGIEIEIAPMDLVKIVNGEIKNMSK